MTSSDELDVFSCPLDGISLIEASAGTGKTWNICGLVLRLLLERGLTVQQVLVVTFTNAATAELRERVRSRIAATLAGLRALPGQAPPPAGDDFVPRLLASLRARPDSSDARLILQLEQALHSFDEAAIFTIHGFCQRALADTPFTAQMPLELSLLADDSELVLQSVNDFWRQQVAAAADQDSDLAAYLLARGDSPQRWARLLKRALAKPLSRLIWPADLDRVADPQVDASALAAAFDETCVQWLANRDAIVATLLAGLSRLNATTYKKDAVLGAAQAWDALLAGAAPSALDTLPDKLALLGSTTLARRIKKGELPPSHPFFDAAQALLDALDRAERALRLARLRLLRDLLVVASQRLRQAKREQRVVAFDDMLFNLYQRLVGADGPALAAALRSRFAAALIDEFQDTDPLQFAVFNRVYGAADGGSAAPLFLVGDPKQAIYSFRHADLHTYLQARAQATARYTLRANQRATAPLIAALNRLFTCNDRAFMQDGLHYQAVALGARPRPLLVDVSEARAPLQVWTLPGDARSGQPLRKAEASAAAAAACAGEIARLLGAAAAGHITLGERPLRAADIAVLVRSHAQGSVMRQALAALGVGSVELSQASVFHSPDAEELARVLAAIIEPGRDGLLKAALATRCLGLSADGIDALSGNEAALLAWTARLTDYRQAWRQRGVGVMLRQWLNAEQVARRLLGGPDGQRRLTNLLHLTECLHQASLEHPAPEALLRWLQDQRDSERGDEATQLRLESDQNLVQIVTIHKSKGLEYPLVFCPFLWDGRLAAASDGLDGVAGHDAQDLPVVDFRKGLDPAFDEAAAKAAARREAAAEFLRLVYVALTRAVQRCYLVAGSYRSQHGRNFSSQQSGRSLLNWLVAGAGIAPRDWLDPKRAAAEPADIAAAWALLVDPLEGASPVALACSALPPARHTPLLPSPSDGAALQALSPPAALNSGWWIASYSSLAHGATSEQAAVDHDLRAQPADINASASAPGSPALDADDLLRFPRGAAAGECIHAVFERADFNAAGSWPAAIAQALQQHRLAPAANASAWPAMLQRMLGDVLSTQLSVGGVLPLRLANLDPERRLVELEFHLLAPALGATALNTLLQRLGYAVPRLAFGALQGFLKGFIDLVFEHDGRFFIADWKSNHLGDTPAHYGQAALATAMAEHNYHLQYLLYSVALHRWLQHKRPGYRYEQHFGGVLYLFVRGLRPGWTSASGVPTGLYFHRPSAQAIEQLGALVDGASATP